MSLSCIICHEYIKENDAATLPCGHIFDRHCIHEWIENSSECPVCRQAVPGNGFDHIIHLYNANDERYRIENIMEEIRSELSKRRFDELKELKSNNLQLSLEKSDFENVVQQYKVQNSQIKQEYADLHRDYCALSKEYNTLKEEMSRLFSALTTSSEHQEILQKSNEEAFKNLDSMQKQLLNDVKSMNERVSRMLQLQEQYVSDSLASSMLKIRSCCFIICAIINVKLLYETRNDLSLTYILLVSLNVVSLTLLQYLHYKKL